MRKRCSRKQLLAYPVPPPSSHADIGSAEVTACSATCLAAGLPAEWVPIFARRAPLNQDGHPSQSCLIPVLLSESAESSLRWCEDDRDSTRGSAPERGPKYACERKNDFDLLGFPRITKTGPWHSENIE